MMRGQRIEDTKLKKPRLSHVPMAWAEMPEVPWKVAALV
jgi:hypothetical protein